MAPQTAAKPAATRIYIVRAKPAPERQQRSPEPQAAPAAPAVRLIRAATPAQVARHLSRDFDIGIASQDDLEEQFGAGVRVELASADDRSGDGDAGGAQP